MLTPEHTHEFRARLVPGECINLPEGWRQIKIEGDTLIYHADRRSRRVQVWPVRCFGLWRINRSAPDFYMRAVHLLDSLE